MKSGGIPTMGEIPQASICVPMFNGAAYLRECLESILAQTFSDFEVLIVDDQSTDESYGIALDYAKRDHRFRVVRNRENIGLVGNWNRSVLHARGEWIKFLFQDDVIESNCLERMLAACGSDTSMVVCKRKIIFEDGSGGQDDDFLQLIDKYNIERVFCGETEISPERFSRAVFDNWLMNFVGEPTAVLLNRSVFSRFGFFNPHLIQVCDYEYWIRVASHSGLKYLPEPLVSFRRHAKSTTAVNMDSRKFRVHLDELVCNHDFLFHPNYRQLRCFAAQCRPPFNLNQRFASSVKTAKKHARQASRNRSDPNSTLLEDMAEITGLFPAFGCVKKIPFSLRFGMYRWKINNFISSLLQTR